MSWSLFIIITIVNIILATIFGLYLRMNILSEYYYELKNENKKYIKYAPIIYVKIIKKAIKIKNKKMLKYFLTDFANAYIHIGLSYCATHGNFDLTYSKINNLINDY